MEKKVNDITTKVEIFVTSKCPRGLKDIVSKLNYSTCQKCPLFIAPDIPDIDGKSKCGYYEYFQKDLQKEIDYDDDCSGGLPCDTYMWRIPCANCGEKILFTSGYSCLTPGKGAKCNKCGLEHFFLRYEKESHVFAIKIGEIR
jgi:predicted RNA-binding Zn-ribbon protein involved in translation (DUF1610 family)